MVCGSCGKEDYVKDSVRFCAGCKNCVVECNCITYGLTPRMELGIDLREEELTSVSEFFESIKKIRKP